MTEYGWLSLVPPVTAIVLALVTRQVYLALFAGILLGTTILAVNSFCIFVNIILICVFL